MPRLYPGFRTLIIVSADHFSRTSGDAVPYIRRCRSNGFYSLHATERANDLHTRVRGTAVRAQTAGTLGPTHNSTHIGAIYTAANAPASTSASSNRSAAATRSTSAVSAGEGSVDSVDLTRALLLTGLTGTALMAGVFFAFSTAVMAPCNGCPAGKGAHAMNIINVRIQHPLFLTVSRSPHWSASHWWSSPSSGTRPAGGGSWPGRCSTWPDAS